MVDIKHIQYPVGQGGLHLGIIDKIAYIYDCGGCEVGVNWQDIYKKINIELKGCEKLYIFISHIHWDHCNKLEEFLNNCIVPRKKITIFLPYYKNATSKLICVCSYLEEKVESKQIEDFLQPEILWNMWNLENTLKDRKFDIQIEFKVDKFENNLLDVYITNISNHLLKKFEKEFRKISPTLLISKPDFQQGSQYLKTARQAYKIIFGKNMHEVMLILSCRDTNTENLYDYYQNTWLHTGDAYLKKSRDICGLFSHFGKFLKYVSFVQIPHHGSIYNRSMYFLMPFGNCKFYRTINDKSLNETSKRVNDIENYTGETTLNLTETTSPLIVCNKKWKPLNRLEM